MVFQTLSEMGKKGIRVRYTELTTLLSIFKVTVERNSRCKSCFWIFNSKFEFKRAMYFTYLEALWSALGRNRKEIYCRFDFTD